jgi:molybdopterin-binding protein
MDRLSSCGLSRRAASIINSAVDELKLKSGQEANAVIKASDVMVAVD